MKEFASKALVESLLNGNGRYFRDGKLLFNKVKFDLNDDCVAISFCECNEVLFTKKIFRKMRRGDSISIAFDRGETQLRLN